MTVLEFPRRFVCRTRVAGGGRVRLRVRGGPGDASRRVPAMWARGGPTASVWQEAATARAAGGAVRAPEREALRRPGRPAAVRDVRGRAATMNQESGGVAGQGAWQASLPALWRVKRAPRLGSVRPRSASPECGYRQALTNLLGRIAVNGHGTPWSRSHSRRRAGSRCGPPEPLRGSRGASPGRRCPWARPGSCRRGPRALPVGCGSRLTQNSGITADLGLRWEAERSHGGGSGDGRRRREDERDRGTTPACGRAARGSRSTGRGTIASFSPATSSSWNPVRTPASGVRRGVRRLRRPAEPTGRGRSRCGRVLGAGAMAPPDSTVIV